MKEIEIKGILVTSDKAKDFDSNILALGAEYKDTESQLNHYFRHEDVSDKNSLIAELSVFFNEEIDPAILHPQTSIRTRLSDMTYLVAKYSSSDSENGEIRTEKEFITDSERFQELDEILLKYGLKYLSKWSRQRHIYTFPTFNRFGKVTACLDKNAGYGYLAELEIMLSEDADKGAVARARKLLLELANKLNLPLLDPARLQKMYRFYNKNWSTFYQTSNYFVIY